MFPILFFLIPIIEMYLLIEVAQEIDILPTVGLVLLTATVGIFLLKRQGFATLARGVSRLNRGELPAVEMVEGLLLAVSGAFLITPGFFTDSIGFILIFHPTRRLAALYLMKRYNPVFASTFKAGGREGPVRPSQKEADRSSAVIEGEFEEKDR